MKEKWKRFNKYLEKHTFLRFFCQVGFGLAIAYGGIGIGMILTKIFTN